MKTLFAVFGFLPPGGIGIHFGVAEVPSAAYIRRLSRTIGSRPRRGAEDRGGLGIHFGVAGVAAAAYIRRLSRTIGSLPARRADSWVVSSGHDPVNSVD